MKKTSLTAIDLFCGCGGMTQGLKQAKFNVLWGIDNASSPLISYKANHPEVCVHEGDIKLVNLRKLMRSLKIKKGELDLLAGCPPCQGFSSMRTKNGSYTIDDDRNDLVKEYFRFVSAFRPKSVMLENVPGLKDNWRFDEFIESMNSLGYRGEWKVLNAAKFGVPQRRRRLIYVAGYKKSITISELEQKMVTVRDAIGDLPPAGESGDRIHDLPEKRTDRIKKMISLVPQDGGSRTDLPDEFVLPCHKRNPRSFTDVYGRMAWDKPAPTITGGCSSPSKGRFLHPAENRSITMREAALLQGFPIDYIFPENLAKDKLSLMIGNALPVPFIKAHAEDIKRQSLV